MTMKTEQTHQQPMTLEEAFEKAVSLYQHQEKEQARKVFEEILIHAPNSVKVLQVLAVLDLEDNHWQSALAHLNKALDVEPDNTSVLFDKACLLTQQRFNHDAKAIIEKLLNQHPEHPEFLSLYQTVLAQLGEKKHSKVIHTQVSERNKNTNLEKEIEETLKLANTFLHEEKLEEAEQLFSAILSFNPSHTETLLQMARVQLKKDEIALARQTLLRQWDASSPSLEVVTLLSHCEIKLENFKKAREYARLGMNTWPNEIIFHQLHIKSYEQEENWLEAYKASLDAFELAPKNTHICYRLAVCYFNHLKKHHNFSIESFQLSDKYINNAIDLCGLDGNYAQLEIMLAENYWYQGKIEKAKQIFEAYVKTHPDDKESLFNLSFIYEALGEWDNYYHAYEAGIDTHQRVNYSGKLPKWDMASSTNETLIVMPEQGVGDEILYFHSLNLAVEHTKEVFAGCDPRLIPIFTSSFPSVTFIPMKRKKGETIHIPEEIIEKLTAWIPSGDLAAQCYKYFGRHHYQQGYISVNSEQSNHWHEEIQKLKVKYKKHKAVGICWRSGLAHNTRNYQYLDAEDVAYLCKRCPDVLFINLQYKDFRKELKKVEKISRVKIHHMNDIDLMNDFENTAALIANLDEVVTAGTAIHRLTNAVGTQCHVFFATAAKFPFYKKLKLRIDNEYVYLFPLLSENKYPLIESICKEVNAIK